MWFTKTCCLLFIIADFFSSFLFFSNFFYSQHEIESTSVTTSKSILMTTSSCQLCGKEQQEHASMCLSCHEKRELENESMTIGQYVCLIFHETSQSMFDIFCLRLEYMHIVDGHQY
jgi:hypothetical protein